MWIGFLVILFNTILLSDVFAGKIDSLRTEIKNKCGKKNIPKQKIVFLIRKVYLDCRSGEDIEIDSGCTIKCLKENIGNIIARRRRF
ncbi:MAG: hypothetical protein OXB84_00475 [Halobacteriovoraceae bacterium]|nr:hypothetical protein [Halobacteriovoraceae bacterium]